MKTTVKHVGSVREWEGPEENSIAHRDVIEHWVNGGEVECSFGLDGNYASAGECTFSLDVEYRIKQREPKDGEVWASTSVDISGAWVKLDFGWANLGISEYDSIDKPQNLTYAAPSVEAYYARKLLEKAEEYGSVLDGHYRDTLETAAKLEK